MPIEELQNSLDNLLKRINEDKAGYASTMLHRFRRHLDELNAVRDWMILDGTMDFEDAEEFDETAKEIKNIIHERLEKRISWQAGLIDQTIANRKAKGTYKGEFTTAVILANAYNDIFQATDNEFSPKED